MTDNAVTIAFRNLVVAMDGDVTNQDVCTAVTLGNVDVTLELIKRHPEHGPTALVHAMREGSAVGPALVECLNADRRIDAELAEEALVLAAIAKSVPNVRAMISVGARPNRSFFYCPLRLMASEECASVIEGATRPLGGPSVYK